MWFQSGRARAHVRRRIGRMVDHETYVRAWYTCNYSTAGGLLYTKQGRVVASRSRVNDAR